MEPRLSLPASDVPSIARHSKALVTRAPSGSVRLHYLRSYAGLGKAVVGLGGGYREGDSGVVLDGLWNSMSSQMDDQVLTVARLDASGEVRQRLNSSDERRPVKVRLGLRLLGTSAERNATKFKLLALYTC